MVQRFEPEVIVEATVILPDALATIDVEVVVAVAETPLNTTLYGVVKLFAESVFADVKPVKVEV